LAEFRRAEIGVSEGMSAGERASTREFDDNRLAARANAERFTIIISAVTKEVWKMFLKECGNRMGGQEAEQNQHVVQNVRGLN
jgi:hypothetical protein